MTASSRVAPESFILFSGCFIRAYLYSDLITKKAKKKFPAKEFGRPRNHFVFGNLVYISMALQLHNDKMIPRTVMVNWNHHVAPIVEIREKNRYEQYI